MCREQVAAMVVEAARNDIRPTVDGASPQPLTNDGEPSGGRAGRLLEGRHASVAADVATWAGLDVAAGVNGTL